MKNIFTTTFNPMNLNLLLRQYFASSNRSVASASIRMKSKGALFSVNLRLLFLVIALCAASVTANAQRYDTDNPRCRDGNGAIIVEVNNGCPFKQNSAVDRRVGYAMVDVRPGGGPRRRVSRGQKDNPLRFGGLDPGTYTVDIDCYGGGGTRQSGSTRRVTILQPTNLPDAGAAFDACQGTPFTLNGNLPNQAGGEGGYSASWTGPATIASPNASTTNATRTTPGVNDYTYTFSKSGCANLTDRVQVTVGAVANVNNNTVTICSGESVPRYTFTNGTDGVIPAGTTYSWSAPAVTGITGTAAGTGAAAFSTGAITNSTAAAIRVRYVITPKTGICDGPAFNFDVNVNPKPTINSVTPAICTGASFTLTPAGTVPTGTQYTWTTAGVTGVTGNSANATAANTFTTGTLTNTSTSAKVVAYTVTPRVTATGCTGATFTVRVTVNVNNTASAPSAANPEGCLNSPFPAITINTTGATGVSNAGVSGANGLPNGMSATWAADRITISGTPTATGPFNYTIRLTGGCGVVNATGSLIVNALPATPTIGGGVGPYCQGATATALSTTATGTQRWWGTAATGGTNRATPTVPTTTAAGTSTYYLSVVDANGCESARGSVIVTTNSLPAAPTVTNPRICVGAPVPTLSATPAANSDALWYNGATGGTGRTTAPTANNTATSTFFVVSRHRTTGCESSPRTRVTVTVNALPSISGGAAEVCTGATTATFTGNDGAPGGALTPAWTRIASSDGTFTINTPAAATTTLTGGTTPGAAELTYTDRNGCVSPAFALEVNARPTITGGAASVCNGATTAIFNGVEGTDGGTRTPAWTRGGTGTFTIGTATATTTTITGGATAGAATLTYTDRNGCPSLPTNITVNALPAAPTVGTIVAPTCTTGASVSLSGLPAGTWRVTPNNGAADVAVTNGNTTTATINNGLAAGTFRFRVRNANGCTSLPSAAAVITSAAPFPGITFAATPPAVCPGTTTATLSYTATVNNPNQYTITYDADAIAAGFVSVTTLTTLLGAPGAITLAIPAGAPPDTYNATMTLRNGAGCTAPAPFSVVVNASPTITGNQTLCAGGATTTLTASALGTGGTPAAWAGGSATIATFAASATVTTTVTSAAATTADGTTNFTFRDRNGCTSAVYPVTVARIPTITATPAAPTEICAGGRTAALTASPSGSGSGTQALRWRVQSGTSATITTSAGTAATVTSATAAATIGTTNIVFQDKNGCSSALFPITVNALPTITPTLAEVCPGDQFNLRGSGTPFTTGTGAWASTVTAVAPLPIPNTTNSFQTVGANTTTGDLTSQITYKDNKGCVSQPVTVTVNPRPTINAITATVCPGGSFNLQGSGNAGAIAWTSTNTTAAPLPSPNNSNLFQTVGANTTAGAVTSNITYKDDNGCISAPITVTVNRTPSVTGPLSVCKGLSVDLTGGTPLAATGNSWSSSSPTTASVPTGQNTTGRVSGLAPGNSDITYTDGNGCQNTVRVKVNDLPRITEGTAEVCEGATTVDFVGIEGTAGGGSPPSWARTGTSIGTFTIDTPGNTNTTLTGGSTAGAAGLVYTDRNTCVSAPFALRVNARPTITGGSNAICFDATTAPFNGNEALPLGTETPTWIGIGDIIVNNPTAASTTVTASPIAGNASLVFTDTKGCQSLALPITINALPTITGGAAVVCEGATTVPFNGNPGSLGGVGTPQWTRVNTSTGTFTFSTGNATTTTITGGTTEGVATLTYTDPKGCTSAPVALTVNAKPTILNGTATVCVGATTVAFNGNQISAGGAGAPSWSSTRAGAIAINSANDFSTTITALTPGPTDLLFTDSKGCESDPFSLLINPIPSRPTNLTPDSQLCSGAAAPALAGVAPVGSSLLWYDSPTGGGGSATPPEVDNRTTDSYYVVSKDNTTGCESTPRDVIQITVNQLPTEPTIGTITQPTCVVVPSIELLDLPSTGTWTVTPDDGSGAAIAPTTGNGATTSISSGLLPNKEYTFIVEDANGCQSNPSAVAEINPLPSNPTLSLGANPAVCFGVGSTSIGYSNPTNGPDQYSIAFTNPAFTAVAPTGLPPSPISLTIPNGQADGSYAALLRVINSATGCFTDQPFTITINPAANALTSGTPTQTVCLNERLNNIVFNLTGATGFTIEWTGSASSATAPAGIRADFIAPTLTLSGSPSAGGSYGYSIKSVNGCDNSALTGSITVGNQLTSAVGTDAQDVCANSPITDIVYTLVKATGYTITWTGTASSNTAPGGIAVSALNADKKVTISGAPNQSGNYGYRISAINGCPESLTGVVLAEDPINTVTISTPFQTLCFGERLQLTSNLGSASSRTAYQWLKNNSALGTPSQRTTYEIPSVSQSDAGSYSVRASNTCGSFTSNSIDINVNQDAYFTRASAAIRVSNTTPAYAELVNFAYDGPAAASYLWDFGNGSGLSSLAAPSHIYYNSGDFSPSLTVKRDRDGLCFATLVLPTSIKVGDSNIKLVAGDLPTDTDTQLSVYPNPFDDLITIEVNQGILNSCVLFDALGREVLTASLDTKNARLLTNELASGVYILIVKTTKAERHLRLVKK